MSNLQIKTNHADRHVLQLMGIKTMDTFNFNDVTNDQVRAVLNSLHRTGRRVRIWYGDTLTGLAWLDEYDVTGTIGRSTGTKPIPLLISNSRSFGGGAILDHCIVRVDCIALGRSLYMHPNFHTGLSVTTNPDQVYPYSAMQKDQAVACFHTKKQADLWVDFMNGLRYRKF